MKNKNKQHNSGFTLIELLVVVAIISLLTSIVLSALASSKSKAIETRTASERRSLQNAMALFYSDKGYYPNPGTIGTRYCIAQSNCINAGSSIPPITGGDFALIQPKIEDDFYKNPLFSIIQIAEAARLGGTIADYPHATPIISVGSTQYSGPMYVCNEIVSSRCTSASIIWTTKNTSCSGGNVLNDVSGSDGSLCEGNAAGGTEVLEPGNSDFTGSYN